MYLQSKGKEGQIPLYGVAGAVILAPYSKLEHETGQVLVANDAHYLVLSAAVIHSLVVCLISG